MSAPGLELAAQFGAAGIIGLMWLSERRASLSREKQLLELHERVREDRVKLRAVLDALQANTRALASLESSQRQAVRQLSLLAARVGRGQGQSQGQNQGSSSGSGSGSGPGPGACGGAGRGG